MRDSRTSYTGLIVSLGKTASFCSRKMNSSWGGRANVARSRASCCVNLRCITLFTLRMRFAWQTQRACKFKQRRLQQCRSLAQHRSAGFLSFVNPGTEFGPIWKPDVGSIFQPDSGAIYCPPPHTRGRNPAGFWDHFPAIKLEPFFVFRPHFLCNFRLDFIDVFRRQN